jgi:hypothetical protein
MSSQTDEMVERLSARASAAERRAKELERELERERRNAKAAREGLALPVYAQLLNEHADRICELEAELERYRAAERDVCIEGDYVGDVPPLVSRVQGQQSALEVEQKRTEHLRGRVAELEADLAAANQVNEHQATEIREWDARWAAELGHANKWCAKARELEAELEHYRAAEVRALAEQPEPGWQYASPADALRPNDRHGMVQVEQKRLADLDSRLGAALRASGINIADTLAVQALYAMAGQSGSHRIVSALRAVETWLREEAGK